MQTGMDPIERFRARTTTGLPRADGDGPAALTRICEVIGAPPCRRGWTLCGRGVDLTNRGSPVQTGMDRRSDGPC